MLFICYKKCSTCTKAKKYLDELGIDYEYREIKDEKPSYEEIKTWHKMSDLPLKRFYNTSGNVYKNNDIKNKIKDMLEDEQYHLLASDGMLVKRPLLISDDKVLVGFKQDEWDGYFNKGSD